MNGNTILIILLVLAATALVVAVLPLIVVADRKRITNYLKTKGLHPLAIRWRPFKRAEMGENSSREYDVICQDSTGKTHHCVVKLAWLVAPVRDINDQAGNLFEVGIIGD
jgi:hypothetical protein